MITVSGTKNHLPVKAEYTIDFNQLLANQNIPYKFITSMSGYLIYEFNDESDKIEALYLRDTIYKTHKL